MTSNSSLSALSSSPSHDVVIIGAGAAGLSAGLWCDELGLKTLVLEETAEIGGQLAWVYNSIENHLGAEKIANGRELRDKFAAQIAQRKFDIRPKALISKVDLAAKKIALENGKQFSARFLILATGVRRRQLNVPGESEFKERGWLESGKRDSHLVTGKTVGIVGGGDAAVENALILSKVAKQVYLIHRSGKFRARPEFLAQIKQQSRITILINTKVLEIIGDTQINRLKLQKDDLAKPFEISVEAVLLRIGVEPNSQLFGNQLKTDSDGYIQVDSCGETSVRDVFAIGDVANPLAPTISGAVGMGATAAKVIANRFSRSD